MVIVTRAFNPETDTGIILDTMPKSIYYDSHPRRGRPLKTWFEQFHVFLTELLKDAVTIMAVSQDDPDHILGYAVFNAGKLIFIYIKDTYRKQGIATMLSKEVMFESFNEETMTKLGRQILSQKQAYKENLLAQPTAVKTETLTTPESKPSPDKDVIDVLIENGFEIQKVTFQSAVLSGFNAAEFQFAHSSTNKLRKPDALYWTQVGVVWKQNGHRAIVPFSNVIQGDID